MNKTHRTRASIATRTPRALPAPRTSKARSALEMRVFYSVAELARAGNVPTYRLLRLLRRNGVMFLRAGRAYYVTLEEIRRRIPPLWESLRMAVGTRSP